MTKMEGRPRGGAIPRTSSGGERSIPGIPGVSNPTSPATPSTTASVSFASESPSTVTRRRATHSYGTPRPDIKLSSALETPRSAAGDGSTAGGSSTPPAAAAAAASPKVGGSKAEVAHILGPVQGQAPNEDDPVVLRMMLAKHRDALKATLNEVHSLKSVVKGLESSIESLQSEKASLVVQLRALKTTEEELATQIQSLSDMCEKLTNTIQKNGVDHATRMTKAESAWRAEEAKLRQQIDRLNTQLVSTQHPTSNARPMPWSAINNVEGHPVFILREVVLQDQRREERVMTKAVVEDDDDLDALVDIKRHGGSQTSSQKQSEDIAIWRQVLTRIHGVLQQRRRLVHTESDTPADFLLRTRHHMVGEVVHAHNEVQRAINLLTTIVDKVETNTSLAGSSIFTGLEGPLELVCTVMGDLDYTFNRIKHNCFSDVDRALYTERRKKVVRPGKGTVGL